MQHTTGPGRNWKALIPVAALLLLVGALGAVLRLGAAGQDGQDGAPTLPRLQQAQTSIALRSTFARPTPTLDCAAGLSWRVVGSPNLAGPAVPGGEAGEGPTGDEGEERGGSVLADVAVLAPNDAWAVGSSHSGPLVETLVEHWDGKEWRIAFSQVVNSPGSRFNSVATVSPGDVWAVGGYLLDGQTVPLIERWNGSEWGLVAPAPVSATVGIFNGVAALTDSDAWAVGYYTDERGISRTLAQHWDGKEWSTEPTPSVGQRLNTLTGDAMRTTDDVWAVGYRVAEKNQYVPITMHWNGKEWRMVEAPAPSKVSNYLYDVTLAGSTDVWAAGYQYNGSGAVIPLLLRWDGGEWRTMAAPQVDSEYVVLNSVSATAEDDVWVAGINGQPDRTNKSLVAHWDGEEWSRTASPGNGATTNNLKSVTALNRTSVWAVGYHDLANRAASTLVAQYGEPCER